MSIEITTIRRILVALSLVASVVLVGGCDSLEGSRGAKGAAGAAGASGATGPAGADVDPATVDSLQSQIDDIAAALDAAASVEPESCAVCHKGVGEEHQAIYDDYVDTSNIDIAITGVASVPDATDPTKFDVTVTFTITKDGMPYSDAAGLPGLDQKRMYSVMYDPATRMYDQDESYGSFTPTGTAGEYTAFKNDSPYDPTAVDSHIYAYVADTALHVHDELTEGTHVHLYDDVSNTAWTNGAGDVTAANAYSSYANVAGCEKCHGTPYMKHGYRGAEVANLADFVACKSCHYDTRNGSHIDWQILVDDPERFAEEYQGGPAYTDAEKAKYAYKARLMNDVHMAHAMEFPYPQSMANCTVCHEGQLNNVLTDAFFEKETCVSCHPVTGPASGTDAHRAPALETLWADIGATFHNTDLDCNNACHNVAADVGPLFSELHSGYDSVIYSDTGVRWSDAIVVTIDDADFDATSNMLTIDFSATEAIAVDELAVTDVKPTLYIGMYGYNAHQYIVGPHDRDIDSDRNSEYAVGAAGESNTRFTTVAAAAGAWQVTFDMSNWSDMLADGTIRRVEIGVAPEVRDVVGELDSRSNGETDDIWYGMVAPSRTFDLTGNAFDDAYFADRIDEAGGCDSCHELLATTFHSPTRGGNVQICKMCHVVSTRGSHLELQSRSIDSYVHAIHSFQPFDIGDIDFDDPVEATMAELHMSHTFPNFTIRNCEACHTEGTYEVPDQSMSLPGVNAGTDTVADRNIGTIAQFVTGPASRACGGCHRAEFLNDDDAGGLAAWHQHVKEFGYLIDDADGVWESVTDTIMAMFE